MIKRISIFNIMYLAISFTSFSIGREVLNFYEETDFENTYMPYIQYEKDSNSDNYNYDYGNGVIKFSDNWFSEYDVKKKYEKNIKVHGEKEKDVDGWETTASLYKVLPEFKIKEKPIYSDLGFMYYYDQLNDSGPMTTTTNERSEFKLRYRLRFSHSLGKGGSFSGVDVLGGPVKSSVNDGKHYELNFVNSTNIGYGFQNITSQNNEVLDYDNYNSTYKSRLENTFRWNYELGENFSFAPEIYFNLEHYSKGTKDEYSNEFTIIPYFLYSNILSDRLSIYAKLGVLGYGVEEYRTNDKTYNESGVQYNITVGFQYLW